jgi:AcrR family transcriptional regulator
MPVNRRTQPEAEKRAQLIAAARQLFVSNGYEATSMSRIAQAAAVTPNTIYWYFRDKDELLIAVLDVLLQEDLQTYAAVADAPLADKLQWAVERLRRVSGLVTTVHNRIRESPSLHAWHERFHALFEQLFTAQLPTRLTSAQRQAEVRIVSFALEGMVAHALDEQATRQICESLATRWAPVRHR